MVDSIIINDRSDPQNSFVSDMSQVIQELSMIKSETATLRINVSANFFSHQNSFNHTTPTTYKPLNHTTSVSQPSCFSYQTNSPAPLSQSNFSTT